ncbi:MAG: oligosaccharide flippase family protein [Mariprofundales bacterium]
MNVVKRNIIANYIGQGWVALMGLAFIPLYIEYLGMEAYGLIGLFAVLQVIFALLDMGMTPTINREMARFTSGEHSAQSIRDLLRSLEVLCFSLAIIIGIIVWLLSDYLAESWLNSEQLPIGVVAQALTIMALVSALRFCEGIYRGSLTGLQKQVQYNIINGALSTLRHAGAVAVLVWWSPSIDVFFIWQAIISLLTIIIFAFSVHCSLPKTFSPAKFSLASLVAIRKFAGGIIAITALAILLTQVDKIMLSKMLSLENFGYYALAGTVSGVLYMLIGPITQAIYPRMVENINSDSFYLVDIYHLGSQLVTIFIAPIAMLMCFFAQDILFVWSGDVSLSQHTAPLLSVLALGSFLNCLMLMPYQCQLAHGWTSLTIKINAVAVLVLMPVLYFIVPIYGAIGAAWIWVVLNMGYVLIGISLMHMRLIPTEKWRWYWYDVFLPLSGVLTIVVFAKILLTNLYYDITRWYLASILIIMIGVSLIVAAYMAKDVRLLLCLIIKRIFSRGIKA